MLGDCTIPAILLNLGATMSNGPGAAQVHLGRRRRRWRWRQWHQRCSPGEEGRGAGGGTGWEAVCSGVGQGEGLGACRGRGAATRGGLVAVVAQKTQLAPWIHGCPAVWS